MKNSTLHQDSAVIKKVGSFFVLLSCLFASTLPYGYCDDRPTSFFGHGFATDTTKPADSFFEQREDWLRGGTPVEQREREQLMPEREESAVIRKPVERAFDLRANEEQSSLRVSAGKRVLSLGAIMASDDPKHLNGELGKLLAVTNRHNIALGEIYFVGTGAGLSQSVHLIELIGKNARIDTPIEVPSQYRVSLSPTWIVQTEEGQILLEGLSAPSNHFNARGEFVEHENPITDFGNTELRGGSHF